MLSTQGTFAMPVYVFSILGKDPSRLFDGESLQAWFDCPSSVMNLESIAMAARNSNMVLVLQTWRDDVPITASWNSSAMSVSSKTCLRPMLAGIASALAGVPDPTLASVDWLLGDHPFGHFSSSTKFSRVFVLTARRHAIISKLSAAWQSLQGTQSLMIALLEVVRSFVCWRLVSLLCDTLVARTIAGNQATVSLCRRPFQ